MWSATHDLLGFRIAAHLISQIPDHPYILLELESLSKPWHDLPGNVVVEFGGADGSGCQIRCWHHHIYQPLSLRQ